MKQSSQSRCKSKPQKPAKPSPDFPLFPHATRRWAKKIRGKLHYFGRWDDPQAALEKLNAEWPYLSQGLTPPTSDNGNCCTFKTLCNEFLNSKRRKMENSELSPRTFLDYHRACTQLIDYFGRERRVDDLRPADFESFRSHLARNIGMQTLRNRIGAIRVVFKFAFDQRSIKEPVHFGQSFDRPSAKSLRKTRNESSLKMFEAVELHSILDAADPIMRAMVLLGINAGLGNTDISSLPQKAVDLEFGWIDFPRPKTEIRRRCPLWPQTIEALCVAIGHRPKPLNPADDRLVFLTKRGRPWVRVKQSSSNPDELMPMDSLSQSFRKLLNSLGINGRQGLGFYTLRHVFATIGGESKDQIAVNAIMGHVDSSMSAVYRERISDERLIDVVNVVRRWLWTDSDASANPEDTGGPSRPSETAT